jgi:hypothetical protein
MASTATAPHPHRHSRIDDSTLLHTGGSISATHRNRRAMSQGTLEMEALIDDGILILDGILGHHQR